MGTPINSASQPGKGARSLAQLVFVTVAVACAFVAVAVAAASSYLYEQSFMADEHARLQSEAHSLASVLASRDGESSAASLAQLSFENVRVTLVDAQGAVLFDNQADAQTLPNHADRPEVAQALAAGAGSSERSSETVGYVSIYEALRLESGEVLRLSVDRASVMTYLARNLAYVVLVVLAVLLVAWLVSRWLAKRYMAPILAIDPSEGLARAPYKELDPLVDRLNDQQQKLSFQMQTVQDASDMRRDFTANVTHELKTPIASISGAAELMRAGLCKPEDVSDFADRIYADAQRLSDLVSDILTLSKLDEAEQGADKNAFYRLDEEADLYEVARNAAKRYYEIADNLGVTLSVSGTGAFIRGNAHLLDELAGNLIDNALRYNKPGGYVKVLVRCLPGGRCALSVRDNGIGIPPESQPRVFQRFYRVDKGRSRSMGGTGLGLAIVKHVANLHQATLSLESELGQGTCITVTFDMNRCGTNDLD